MRTLRPEPVSLPFPLPALRRRRPRCYEEWVALKRWGRLPSQERSVIGYQLRELRETRRLSQADLASQLGCSQQAISQAERWTSNPTFNFINRWGEALGVAVEVRLVQN